jgi:hypothetical protein
MEIFVEPDNNAAQEAEEPTVIEEVKDEIEVEAVNA